MKRLLGAVCVLAVIMMSAHAGEVDVNAVAASAKKAAEFLLKQQNEDGTIGNGVGAINPGYVGLIVKALASSPEKLREDNPVVAKAVKYMLSQQQPSGAINNPKFPLENYNTSCTAIALVALENPAHKEVLEKAKKFILTCQHGDAEFDAGGFDYGNKKETNLSTSGFSMEALKAMGLEENSPAWKNAAKFIKRCQDNDETNDLPDMKGGNNSGAFFYGINDSEFGTYVSKSGKKLPKPYGNMTYQAVKSLVCAGVTMDDPSMQAAFKWIKSNYAVDRHPGGDGAQGYYYYVNVFAKAFAAAGVKELTLADGKKVNWAKDLAAHLISVQKPDGSFVNAEKRWMESDPELATAYALDAMNLCINAMK